MIPWTGSYLLIWFSVQKSHLPNKVLDWHRNLYKPFHRWSYNVMYYTMYYTKLPLNCMMTCSINDKTSRIFVQVNWLHLVCNQIIPNINLRNRSERLKTSLTVMPDALIKWNIWKGVQHIKKTEHNIIIKNANLYWMRY